MIILFPLAGFWLWAVVVVSFVLLGSWVYRERYLWATGELLLVAALLSVTGHIPIVNMWHHVQANQLQVGLYVASYVVLGLLWSTYKWNRLTLRLGDKYKVWRKTWVDPDVARTERDLEELRKDRKVAVGEAWSREEARLLMNMKAPREPKTSELPFELQQRYVVMTPEGKPKLDVGRYKERIIGWIVYWWVSLVVWFIGDFLADVGDALYRLVRDFYQKMADRAFEM